MNDLICPFCGARPFIGPDFPMIEGNGFIYAECKNTKCPAKPRIDFYDNNDEIAGKTNNYEQARNLMFIYLRNLWVPKK